MYGTYLTTPQASERLTLAVSTLEKLRVTGGGPKFLKLGRRVVYTIADLDAYATGGARNSTSDPGKRHALGE